MEWFTTSVQAGGEAEAFFRLNSGSWTDEVLDLDAAADAEMERFRPKGA